MLMHLLLRLKLQIQPPPQSRPSQTGVTHLLLAESPCARSPCDDSRLGLLDLLCACAWSRTAAPHHRYGRQLHPYRVGAKMPTDDFLGLTPGKLQECYQRRAVLMLLLTLFMA